MRAKVREVNGNACVVEFAGGTLRGVWATPPLPAVGAVVDLEVNLDSCYEDAAVASGSVVVGTAEAYEAGSRVAARVEAVDDDGMAFLRLSGDCLVMLEASPGTLSVGDVARADCPTETVSLWRIGGA